MNLLCIMSTLNANHLDTYLKLEKYEKNVRRL